MPMYTPRLAHTQGYLEVTYLDDRHRACMLMYTPRLAHTQGYLEVTYLDDRHRVGRDDKGNLFVLQRVAS